MNDQTIANKNARQQENLKNLKYLVKSPNKYLKRRQDRLLSNFKELNNTDLLVLNYLLRNNLRNDLTYCKQETIAKNISKSLSTVKRSLKKLKELDFIKKINRGRISCLYKTSSLFFYKRISKKLCHFLPSLQLILNVKNIKKNELLNYINIYNKKEFILSSCKKNQKRKTLRPIVIRHVIPHQQSQSTFIRKDILNFSLNLTLNGQIILSQFDEDAIAYAQKNYDIYAEQLQNPFAWAYTVCLNHHYSRQKAPNREFCKILARKYKVKYDQPLFIPKEQVNVN